MNDDASRKRSVVSDSTSKQCAAVGFAMDRGDSEILT